MIHILGASQTAHLGLLIYCARYITIQFAELEIHGIPPSPASLHSSKMIQALRISFSSRHPLSLAAQITTVSYSALCFDSPPIHPSPSDVTLTISELLQLSCSLGFTPDHSLPSTTPVSLSCQATSETEHRLLESLMNTVRSPLLHSCDTETSVTTPALLWR